jgi:hypothetical protein
VDIRIAVPEEQVSGPVLDAGQEAVTRLNEKLIRDGDAPLFHEAIRRGVKWQPEPPGAERFDHAKKVIGRGWGDCDDLAPYHAASLRVTGEDKRAKAVVYPTGPHRWHAVVRRGDGRLEDPSQTAGMKVRKGSRTAGIPAAVVGCMAPSHGVHGSVRPFVAVRREGVGWVARTDLPILDSGYGLSTTQRSSTPAGALAGSIRGACIVGHCSGGMADEEHLGKLWALQGLLHGDSAESVASVVGVERTKEAVKSLAGMAPAILREIREHRAATESRGHRAAGGPFRDRPRSVVKTFDFGRGFNRAVAGRMPAPRRINGFLEDVGHVVTAQNVVKAMQPQAKVAGFFGDIVKAAGHVVHDVSKVASVVVSSAQGVISLIPGIGTGISAAIGAGMALLEGGSPLDIAVKTAYGAIPIPPGLRTITDGVVDAALSLVHTKNLTDAAIAAIRSAIPSGLPQQVFDTLAHIVLQAIHKQPTLAVVTHAPGKPAKVAHVPPVKAPHVTKPKAPGKPALRLKLAAKPVAASTWTLRGATVIAPRGA